MSALYHLYDAKPAKADLKALVYGGYDVGVYICKVIFYLYHWRRRCNVDDGKVCEWERVRERVCCFLWSWESTVCVCVCACEDVCM